LGGGFFFFVVETKEDESGRLYDRMRPIFWPRRHNEWLSEVGYVADLPLFHTSRYIDAVRNDAGAVADFASGSKSAVMGNGAVSPAAMTCCERTSPSS
jgi:hypothetical protein